MGFEAPPDGLATTEPALVGCDKSGLGRRTIAGGIVVPPLLTALDPALIFWASPWPLLPNPAVGPPLLRNANVLGLTCIAFAVILLCLIGAKPMRAPWLSACAGALACASALPALICVFTVPAGVLLLRVGVGALGFLPAWTAYEWTRVAMRALDRSTEGQRARATTGYALCGALALASICVSAQYLTWRSSVKHDVAALLATGHSRVDFSKEFTFEWDRIVILDDFVDDDQVRKLLGFEWTSNGLRQLGSWRHNTLLIFLNGDTVAASALFEGHEFGYCKAPAIIPRDESVMEIRGRSMCRPGGFR